MKKKILGMIFIANYWMVSMATAASFTIPIPDFADSFAPPEAFFQFWSDADPNGGLVHLADSKGATQTQVYLDLPGAENIAQGFTFHNRHLYAMVMIGKYPQWKREFWRYDENRKGTKLFEGKISGDFRVSSDEKYIALCEPDGTETGSRLDILNAKDGKLVKFFSTHELGLSKSYDEVPLNLISFYGGALWVCDGENAGDVISHFVKIDEDSWKMTIYDCHESIIDSLGFNPYHQWVVYDDYPLTFETAEDQKFQATKTPIHLFVYDVQSQKKKLITTAPVWRFSEKWIGKDTLEYNNPNGKGPIQKEITDDIK